MGLPPVPEVLRNRDFNLYWAGVVLSQIGTRATVAANLYHVYHLTGSIAQTGLMVDTILTDATAADRLRGAGVSGDFTLAPRNNGTTETPKYTVPAEQLTVTGPDPDEAVRSVTALSALFEQELADLQARAGVRAAGRITAQVLVPPTAAPILGSKIRGLVGVAALGILGAVLIPHWFERYARRRARRSAASRRTSERVAPV